MNRRLPQLLGLVAVLALLAVGPWSPAVAQSAPGATTRVSVSSDGAQGNLESYDSDISANGRFVAFYSKASNLVSGDTNGFEDVFVHDRQTGATTRVSISSAGVEANGVSIEPAISANGQYIAFSSRASNLVPGDTNGDYDVFVHDRETGTTTRVSISSTGVEGNWPSRNADLSTDGRFVTFSSQADTFVSPDTNGIAIADIFVHDRQTSETTRVSVSSTGVQANRSAEAPEISADGRYVAFTSEASNLVSNDTNSTYDVFVHDRLTSTTIRASVSSAESQANDRSDRPSFSAEGRYVAFESRATNLVSSDSNGSHDVFVRDLQMGTTTRVSVNSTGRQGNALADYASISADGRFIAFSSEATNLVSGDTNDRPDIFVHDRQTGATTRVSVDSAGGQGNNYSYRATISADGSLVAFGSSASNLVAGDTNAVADIFIHEIGLSAGYSISGLILDQDTAQLPGVEVCIQSGPCATSRENGTFTINVEAAGTYQISAAKFGYVLLPATRTVSVPPDAADQDFSAAVVLSSISGRITHPVTGNPLAGIEVTLDGQTSSQTNANGDYTFSGVMPGQHTVSLYNCGPVPTPLTVLVPPDATQNNFALANYRCSIAGQILNKQTSEPLAGATVYVGNQTAETGGNGVYSMLGFYGGVYVATPTMAGVEFTPAARTFILPPDQTNLSFFGQPSAAIELVSASSPGVAANSESWKPVVSADGRFVAFESFASDLVPNDTNGKTDVFLADRQSLTIVRASVDESGAQLNGESFDPAISADGRYVAFVFEPSGPTIGRRDIYLFDRLSATARLISLAPTGSAADYDSFRPAISADGQYIAFESSATNLVAGDTNGDTDIFLRDVAHETTTLISVSSAGVLGDWDSRAPSISADGHFVAFESVASNLVLDDTNEANDIFLRDVMNGVTTRVSLNSAGEQGYGDANHPRLSADGQLVAFYYWGNDFVAHDTNGAPDVFVRDLQAGVTSRISVSSAGTAGNGDSMWPDISPDGRYVAFQSFATNLAPSDVNNKADIFVHDRQAGTTRLVSESVGLQTNNDSEHVSISLGGCIVVFDSLASNLAPGNTGNLSHIYSRFMLSLCDEDQDGIAAGTELGAPNVGDGNGDGAPDSDQAYVASLPSSGSGEYVTLAIDNQAQLTGVAATGNPAPGGGLPTPMAAFPLGFLQFEISGLVPGGTATSELFVEGGVTTDTYYKYGKTPDNPTDHWYEFLYDGTTGAEILADKIVLHFVDGQRGDGDLFADGDIEDPGAPALTTIAEDSAIYLSPTQMGNLGVGSTAIAFTNADILTYHQPTNTWDIFYDGSTINTTKNLGAFAFRGGDVILGFSVAQLVPGLGAEKVTPQDLVRFMPSRTGYNNTTGQFARFFDGSDVGLTTAGESIDALWIDHEGRFYISTAGSGVVPANSIYPSGAKVKFQDEDVLRFTPTTIGATTAGLWELYWDPTRITKMSVEDINGYWEDPATGHRYVTILGAFTVGNAAYGGIFSGDGKTILRFVPNAAAPGGYAPAEKLTWLASGSTLPPKFAIDGIEMAR